LTFKPAVLIKALDPFSAKLLEVTLLLEWPEESDNMAVVDATAQIKLKSFEQPVELPHSSTGGQALIAQAVNTETSIKPVQLELYNVNYPYTTRLRKCLTA